MNEKGLILDRHVVHELSRHYPRGKPVVEHAGYYKGRRVLRVTLRRDGQLYSARNFSGTIEPEELVERFMQQLDKRA